MRMFLHIVFDIILLIFFIPLHCIAGIFEAITMVRESWEERFKKNNWS